MLIKWITKEIVEVPIIFIKLSADLTSGIVKLGVHDQIAVGFDFLYGNDLANQNNAHVR